MYIEKVSFKNENGYGTILQLIIQLIYFKLFQCIEMLCTNIKLGKYEYCAILHLIIQLINFKVCSSIYRICCNRT